MITGYNTDVRHQERVFHVQTEDKGTENPYIESLIYVGGQVLAAKRTDYAELVQSGAEDADVATLMQQQHQAMIDDLLAGSYDEKVVSLVGAAAPVPSSEASLDEIILEYLTKESGREQLVLALEEDVELELDSINTLAVRASSSRSGLPVGGAEVTFKLLAKGAEPVLLESSQTDEQGVVQLEFEVPGELHGSGALIISATSGIGSAELKYLL